MTKIEILQKYFNYPAFRDGQEDVIDSILSGKNTLLVMPTGGGKSLTYQIPGLMLDGLILVVSPLIALMRDQVRELRERGIEAATLNSEVADGITTRILAQTKAGKIKFLFITPERLTQLYFRQFLKTVVVGLLVIDEAHCITQWGESFRPAYKNISNAIKALGYPTVLALTASATVEMQEQILESLKIEGAEIFTKGFFRPNLKLYTAHVKSIDEKDRQFGKLLKLCEKPCIVYVGTRSDAENYCNYAQRLGHKTSYFHGNMLPEDKIQSQEAFMSGNLEVIVATKAFGMGINKANVRTIIHLHFNSGICDYYQEIGRAGRDGEIAQCFQIFCDEDISLQHYFIDMAHPPMDWYEKVVEYAVENVNVHGVLEDSYKEISKQTGVPSGSIKTIFANLRKEKYVTYEVRVRRYKINIDSFSDVKLDWRELLQGRLKAFNQLADIQNLAKAEMCLHQKILDLFGDTGEVKCPGCQYCSTTITLFEQQKTTLLGELKEDMNYEDSKG